MTVQLESGKFYQIADGRKVGPMRRAIDDDQIFITTGFLDEYLPVWNPDGTADFFGYESEENEPYHIVKEWVDE